MNNEELEKNVNFVMTHLDEVLDSDIDMFDDIVNYDVLSKASNVFQGNISRILNILNGGGNNE